MSRSSHQPSAPWRHIDDWRCIPASVKRRLAVDTRMEIARDLTGVDDNECDGNCPLCDVAWDADAAPVSENTDGRRWTILDPIATLSWEGL